MIRAVFQGRDKDVGMPLSEGETTRTPLHTRRVTCQGFRRADGLWEIEGRIVDTKAYAFENHDRGRIEIGDPLHDMSMRLTIDSDFVITGVEAVTDKAPYHMCPAITPNFQRLVGLRIGPGFLRQSRKMVGGTKGCTHLVELLGPMATTAFQTIASFLKREMIGNSGDASPASDKKSDGLAIGKPTLLGTCHAYAPGSPVVARLWPDKGKQAL